MKYYEQNAIFVHPVNDKEHPGTAEITEAINGLVPLKPTLTIHGFRKEISNGNLAFVSALLAAVSLAVYQRTVKERDAKSRE